MIFLLAYELCINNRRVSLSFQVLGDFLVIFLLLSFNLIIQKSETLNYFNYMKSAYRFFMTQNMFYFGKCAICLWKEWKCCMYQVRLISQVQIYIATEWHLVFSQFLGQTGNNPKVLQWVYIHSVEDYSATTWMILKSVTLSERSQTQRNPNRMIPCIWHSRKGKTPRDGEQMGGPQELVGWGQRRVD